MPNDISVCLSFHLCCLWVSFFWGGELFGPIILNQNDINLTSRVMLNFLTSRFSCTRTYSLHLCGGCFSSKNKHCCLETRHVEASIWSKIYLYWQQLKIISPKWLNCCAIGSTHKGQSGWTDTTMTVISFLRSLCIFWHNVFIADLLCDSVVTALYLLDARVGCWHLRLNICRVSAQHRAASVRIELCDNANFEKKKINQPCNITEINSVSCILSS